MLRFSRLLPEFIVLVPVAIMPMLSMIEKSWPRPDLNHSVSKSFYIDSEPRIAANRELDGFVLLIRLPGSMLASSA